MSNIPYELERLIVRHLDSELTEEEELQLNRELIRNPEARNMLDDYTQADALAVAALNRVVTEQGPIDVAMLAKSTIRRRRAGYYRAWWVIPGAVAAAVLALLIPGPSVGPDKHEPVQISEVRLPPLEEISRSRTDSTAEMMRNVSAYPSGPRIKRNTGREVFGVVGDDGNVYWIQVDRIRTMKRPRRPASGRLSNEVM